ncbi:MAG: damage-inducible protein CinA, partial [Bacilli bacterium]|nr:damage-inducible protein CinA [Bacilli bacterium]
MESNKNIKVKIITIGDELLLGQVINTNASWLGEQLNFNGFKLDSIITIGDGEEDILNALDSCSDANIVIITGGLGPTADDITKPTLCKFFDTELVLNDDALENINSIFKLRGY